MFKTAGTIESSLLFLPKRHFKLSATLKDYIHILIKGVGEEYSFGTDSKDGMWFEGTLPLKGFAFP
jgi:hypothetical protein